MRKFRRFENKKALITGATGGIGSSLVKALKNEGALVAVTDLDTSKIDADASFDGDLLNPKFCDELPKKVFDKSTKVVNTLTDDRQFTDGLNIVNIAKLISSIIGGKNQGEKEKLKASEVLPYVFADDFFINDLNLRQDQILGFLIYVDSKLPSQKLLQVSQQFQLIDFLIIESNNYKNQL